MLRASELERTRAVENGDFKFLVWDGAKGAPRMPRGTVGFRWQHEKGQWNLELKDGLDGEPIDARLTALGEGEVAEVAFDEYGSGRVARNPHRGRAGSRCRGLRTPRHADQPAPARALAPSPGMTMTAVTTATTATT